MRMQKSKPKKINKKYSQVEIFELAISFLGECIEEGSWKGVSKHTDNLLSLPKKSKSKTL